MDHAPAATAEERAAKTSSERRSYSLASAPTDDRLHALLEKAWKHQLSDEHPYRAPFGQLLATNLKSGNVSEICFGEIITEAVESERWKNWNPTSFGPDVDDYGSPNSCEHHDYLPRWMMAELLAEAYIPTMRSSLR